MPKQFDPPGYHNVEDGDWLSVIAQWYGFHQWEPIWNDANNATLKSTRQPNLLFPGDQVYVPALTPNDAEKGSGATHAFKTKATPDDLTIIPVNGTVAGAAIKLAVVKGKEPTSVLVDAVNVTLKVGSLNSMDPSLPDKGVSGVQARLNNLGLRAGPEDGTLTDRTRRSIRLFQKLENLAVDGNVTADLTRKLSARHGV